MVKDGVRCNSETFNNYSEFLNWSELETEIFKTCQDKIGSVVRRRNDTKTIKSRLGILKRKLSQRR